VRRLWPFRALCLLLVPVLILMQLCDPIPAPALGVVLAAVSIATLVLGLLALRHTAKYRRLANLAWKAPQRTEPAGTA
jgi:hypothetical protein